MYFDLLHIIAITADADLTLKNRGTLPQQRFCIEWIPAKLLGIKIEEVFRLAGAFPV